MTAPEICGAEHRYAEIETHRPAVRGLTLTRGEGQTLPPPPGVAG
jgi:hypothetical protein